MSTSRTDIFIAGVGGQGSLSASKFIGEAAAQAGVKVVVGEIHGMAMRGGMVTSTVRMGDVHGAIIGRGSADVLLGFEPVEAWRYLEMTNPGTLVITNTRTIVPPGVSMSGQGYPRSEEVVAALEQACEQVIAVDATGLALDAGTAMAINAVLLGVLGGTGRLPFSASVLREVIEAGVPPGARAVNCDAFDRGLAIGRDAVG
jgi:indolepyruvate ferredoxin oxidoreductase beta subunit